MRYLTDRKRAQGRGSAGRGTEHHWSMTVTAVGLAFIVPTWLYILGRALGQDRAGVIEAFSHPFAAILTALLLVIGLRHFTLGAITMIEDYTRGSARRIGILIAVSLAWGIGAAGIFALMKIAL
ncbi:MAG: succinate dehydrogenase, hydrophobic membrane anchor protein [Rubellimicrobium sp.]|nr:succinate dehydrogenase, hydrophobic membrane anchor protein [Rubellimicrobium sp.]